MALPITKFLNDIREGFENMKTFRSTIVEYFSLKNQMLLELSDDWASGTKTVPGVSKYETIEVFPYADTYGSIICKRTLNGRFAGGGIVADISSSMISLEISFNVSGDALTLIRCRYSAVNGSGNVTAAQIRKIKGAEPKLPDTLKNIIGGGYYIDSLLHFLERRCSHVCN